MVDNENPSQLNPEVSAWRSIFVANEWAELQCEFRVIEPETSFIFFVFFWTGLGWKELSKADPDMTVAEDPNIRLNVFLKFFWVAVIFYGVYISRMILFFVRGAVR